MIFLSCSCDFYEADILVGSFYLEKESHTKEEKLEVIFSFHFVGTSYRPEERVFRHRTVTMNHHLYHSAFTLNKFLSTSYKI